MSIRLGTLEFTPTTEHKQLFAQPVFKTISMLSETNKVGVVEIDPTLSDTAAFCQHYKVNLDQTVNCVIVEATRASKKWFAACVVFGNTRADINGLARRTLGARTVSFAQMDRVVAETGMEYGAITPIGLPRDWPILIDQTVAGAEYVIVGSGIRKSKIAIPGSLLASLPGVQILESLGVKQLA